MLMRRAVPMPWNNRKMLKTKKLGEKKSPIANDEAEGQHSSQSEKVAEPSAYGSEISLGISEKHDDKGNCCGRGIEIRSDRRQNRCHPAVQQGRKKVCNP